MAETKSKELSAVVLPKGSIHLVWGDGSIIVNKTRAVLQNEILRRYEEDRDSWLFFLGFCEGEIPLSPSLDYLRAFSSLFAQKLSLTPDLEVDRHRVTLPVEDHELGHFLETVPAMKGAEYLNRDQLERLWAGLNTFFTKSLKSYDGTVEAFLKEFSPEARLVGRVFFHLVENKDNDYPFAFLATYSTRLDMRGKSRHLPLKHALEEYGDDEKKLLTLLTQVYSAAGKSPLIQELIETGELFHPLAWGADEAYSFLREIPIYEDAGILCRIPNWWKGKTSGLKLNISIGNSKPALMGMEALLSFKAQLFIGDIPITEKEARRLLTESEGLAYIKNKWIAVDPEKLRQTLAAYEKAKGIMKREGLTLQEALRLQLEPQKLLDLSEEEVEYQVSHGTWLQSVMKKLVDPDLVTTSGPDKAFRADLRGYQQVGLNWLWLLHSLNFGACLADDMGLGKTVQVLAFLSLLKEKRKESRTDHGPSLLIIPASLISNWEREIRNFSPHLKTFIAHPGSNSSGINKTSEEKTLRSHDLVITTYAMSRRYEWIRTQTWDYIILDEAQAIKNPGTKQTREIKSLSARNRIIMTGTPIENSLRDLWSLFDFLNPGLLGNPKEFSRLSKKLQSDSSGYSGLRKLIRPYILRRLKTDRSIISDLPDKVEMKTYTGLSRKQVVLYQELVERIKESISRTEGIQRKGIILSSLMKLKQLCNHPDQYLGAGAYHEKDSGKFSRLREICETIHEKGEKALVFTQFKEITGPLSEFLEALFNRRGLILHGSVAVKKRKGIIERFQEDDTIPFMVLSLKAGGIGLNLTEANHVIHFDRWWNPAVEDQATDRAYRIGQKRKVIVHKFLTRDTIEERIDMMLEKKAELSKELIAGTGESWITEMSNDELVEMFRFTG